MPIWVDADACPNVIKEILFRAADRRQVMLTLVANAPLRVPPSRYIRTLQVPGGFDEADRRIAELAQAGDLVVTADVPLAADAVAKGAQALSPRGELYTRENVKERLAMRNLMDELRKTGVATGGPRVLSLSDRQAFANQLDRFLNASVER
ncbi:hypothetical protein SVA_1810 [Sulfurifustis variabilis]|uniref:UPF0178 protein SVA_1810 n=1 Tax=Sulfurifustis variabilis TaxID=1675686 RepID=A0A1B4VA28_9GAMM|nr:YaiI/YqxD family protein [Sulfurifustis variabilis]BAU48364.1 hypothetical protein SVA_1810 [Sulfurifustis variabilis]